MYSTQWFSGMKKITYVEPYFKPFSLILNCKQSKIYYFEINAQIIHQRTTSIAGLKTEKSKSKKWEFFSRRSFFTFSFLSFFMVLQKIGKTWKIPYGIVLTRILVKTYHFQIAIKINKKSCPTNKENITLKLNSQEALFSLSYSYIILLEIFVVNSLQPKHLEFTKVQPNFLKGRRSPNNNSYEKGAKKKKKWVKQITNFLSSAALHVEQKHRSH